uniref:Beta-glucuronidase n=1 Tax=Chaetomium globosum TaxID=38033 RepID=A0A6G8IQN4_CHAGS|nr:beta-D-glucuronidase [Chaetomium globosum]
MMQFLSLVLLWCCRIPGASTASLKPQANEIRTVISLDGIWNFALGSAGVEDPDADKAWQEVIRPEVQIPVPASYNDVLVDARVRNHVGWVYYQRYVTVPKWFDGQHYFLRFDAATHHGRVYVDDTFVTEHKGGYTPFEADIGKLVKPGQRFRLTVAVSNVLTWETIPPGQVQTRASGKKAQVYRHDFFNYAGLARSVWLCAVPRVHVRDVTVTTDITDNGAHGVVRFDIQTSVSNGGKVRVTLLDEKDIVVGSASNLTGSIDVSSPHLWKPGAAYLYQLRVEIVADGDEVLDSYDVPVGIRSVKISGNRFLVNGEPFYFTGFGKHEDSPIRGKGHDPAYMVHDFGLMKSMGANSFRTSHYPYAEEVFEYADRHGVLVIDETPAVGLNLAIAGGVMGGPALPTFSDDTVSNATREAHAQAIRELVARDKNHPSVVMWCVANEPASGEPGAREYFEPLVKLTRELDPTRPVMFTNERQAGPDRDRITDLFDVVALNRYYGWYVNTGDLESAEIEMEAELRQWQAKFDKPIILSEFGADTMSGLHTSMADVPWSEEYQTSLLEMSGRVLDRLDSVTGEHVWAFSDFQTGSSSIARADGNKKGVFTRDRRPKSAAVVLKRRWEAMRERRQNGTRT